MKLIVGLGNPGKEYEATRHNAGFMAVDFLCEHYAFSQWSKKKKFSALISEGLIGGEKVILMKPELFMNLSGGSVQSVLNFYKIDASDMIVIHDDTDLNVGSMKIQAGRGSAGHNGIKSIVSALGGNDFTRIRLGVRPENNNRPAMNIVLQRMSPEDRTALKDMFPDIHTFLVSS